MQTRLWTCAVAALSVFSFAAQAQQWDSGPRRLDEFGAHRTMGPNSILAPSPVDKLLSKPIETVDWSEITFEEVLNWLRDQANESVNIVPRWGALALEDVDPDKFIERLVLSRTTVGEVLDEVLDQLSETGEVTYRGEGNTLRISTRTAFDRKLELRVYDVTDILFRVPDFSESAPQVDLQRQSNQGGGGGGGGRPIFTGTGGQSQQELSEEGENDPEEILEDLVQLIRDTIEPLSWEEGGGGRGRIRGFNRRHIVVYNTVAVHELINGYFSRSR